MDESVIEEAINYEKLRVDGYNLESIIELTINSAINEHSVLNLVGILTNDSKERDINETTSNKYIEVYYDIGEKKTLFYGIVTDIQIGVEEDIYMLRIEAKSMSYLMDIKLKSRSFQNISLTTHNIVDYIMKEYSNSNYVLNMPSEPIGELLVQYEETDWEFIKRIASKYNLGLIPRMNIKNIDYVMGLSDDAEKMKCNIQRKEVYKSITEYDYMRENVLEDASESDYLECRIKSYDFLTLGKSVNIFNQDFYIYNALYEIENSLLVNTYNLRRKNGIRQKRLYNEKVIGSSLNGKIIEVKNDVVKVHLDIDDLYKNKSDVYWFKFSTISASTDGSGWYYMPEVGDNIKVYFPSKDEDKAFAISAVSEYIQGADEQEDRMADPDNKYLRNPSGKEVKLTNDGIYISCNGGQATMSFTNAGTLNITSANNINVIAEENIDIFAQNNLFMTSENEIFISSNQGGIYGINSEGEIIQSGIKLKNN